MALLAHSYQRLAALFGNCDCTQCHLGVQQRSLSVLRRAAALPVAYCHCSITTSLVASQLPSHTLGVKSALNTERLTNLFTNIFVSSKIFSLVPDSSACSVAAPARQLRALAHAGSSAWSLCWRKQAHLHSRHAAPKRHTPSTSIALNLRQ